MNTYFFLRYRNPAISAIIKIVTKIPMAAFPPDDNPDFFFVLPGPVFGVCFVEVDGGRVTLDVGVIFEVLVGVIETELVVLETDTLVLDAELFELKTDEEDKTLDDVAFVDVCIVGVDENVTELVIIMLGVDVSIVEELKDDVGKIVTLSDVCNELKADKVETMLLDTVNLVVIVLDGCIVFDTDCEEDVVVMVTVDTNITVVVVLFKTDDEFIIPKLVLSELVETGGELVLVGLMVVVV